MVRLTTYKSIKVNYFKDLPLMRNFIIKYAPVVELADTRDLKSLGVKPVPVQVRLGAPLVNCFLKQFS